MFVSFITVFFLFFCSNFLVKFTVYRNASAYVYLGSPIHPRKYSRFCCSYSVNLRYCVKIKIKTKQTAKIKKNHVENKSWKRNQTPQLLNQWYNHGANGYLGRKYCDGGNYLILLHLKLSQTFRCSQTF